MGSKAFIFLCLLLAFVLLISSQVASADKSIDPSKEEVTSETNGVEEAKYGGRGGYNNGGGGYNNGGGGYNHGGGGYNNGGGHRGGGYNNGGGHRGGGYNNGGGHRGGGYNNGGGHHGGNYCRHGCCDENAYGSGCGRCCSYAGEAATTTTPGN